MLRPLRHGRADDRAAKYVDTIVGANITSNVTRSQYAGILVSKYGKVW
jgi:hypothetical protein